VTVERKQQINLRIITNRMDVSAEEISKMYQSRWQIELFFKHFKKHMRIKNYFLNSYTTID